MKIAVLGGAGLMARVTLCDLKESPEVERILVADLQLDAATRAVAAVGDPRFVPAGIDVRDVDATATLLSGYDVVINSTQYYFNLEVMRAALKARAQYLDLGGLFHMTRKQMQLHDDFVKADLLAVMGVGSTPGLTNVMARYAVDRLDKVFAADVKIGAADLSGYDTPFSTPYSLRTIVDECVIPPYVYEGGEWKEVALFSGEEEVQFPAPIGAQVAHYTIHSEVASFPLAFGAKGLQRATFRIAFPAPFIGTLKQLFGLKLLSDEPVRVGPVSVKPRDLVIAVLGAPLAADEMPNDCDCIRVEVHGEKDGRDTSYTMDCLVRPHRGWKVSAGALDTGVPPSIVAQMLARHAIPERGVLSPEQCIPPAPFFEAMARRGMHVHATVREAVT